MQFSLKPFKPTSAPAAPSSSSSSSASSGGVSTDSGAHEESKSSQPSGTKHPLQREWTLSFSAPKNLKQRQGDYDSGVKDVLTVKSIEDFWSLYNNVKPPTDLREGSDLYFFKKDIRPVYEDPKNDGGWDIKTDFRSDKTTANQAWENILLALIGEQFTDIDKINGARFQMRRGGSKLALWTEQVDESVRDRIASEFQGLGEFRVSVDKSGRLIDDKKKR